MRCGHDDPRMGRDPERGRRARGPVNDIAQTFADPQVQHLRVATPVTHPAVGPIEIVRNATTLEGVPNEIRRPAPEAGEHSDEILRQFGLDDAEIDASDRTNHLTASVAIGPARHLLHSDLTFPFSVIAKGRIALGDHLPKSLLGETLDPLIGLLGMTRDAIEEGPKELRRSQPHVLEGLVDEKLVEGELIGRNIFEPSRMRLDSLLDFVGGADSRNKSDPMCRLRIDRVAAQRNCFACSSPRR